LRVTLCGETGSKRVPGKQPVEANSGGGTFDHVGNGSIAEASWPHTSVSIDTAESGAGVDFRSVHPGSPRSHWACRGMRSVGQTADLALGFLVGFRASDSQNKSVGIFVDIIDVKRDKLAAAQRSCKADQYERAVPYIDQFVGQRLDERSDHLRAGSSNLAWRNAIATPNSCLQTSRRRPPSVSLCPRADGSR
jgi:hypothetical protein